MHNVVRMIVALLVVGPALAQSPANAPTTAPTSRPAQRAAARDGPELARRTWTLEGEERFALLHVPREAARTDAPVVFAFHGHGGSARQAARSFRMHAEWPEAIVVYMQGLPTPGRLVDPEGKRNGWQNRAGVLGDRDLKFFDAVLATLKAEYRIDARRIYAMGHSNGGGFTYLLWRERPDVFAAFAPSGAFTLQAANLAPRPVMHIAGRKDELVKFEWQQRTIDAVRKLNGCAGEGEPWGRDCTLYPSKSGTPLVTMIYNGSHRYPAEAPALIAKFFREQVRPRD